MSRSSGFTRVEAICLLALLGCLGAVVVSQMQAELRLAHTAEAVMNVRVLYDSTASYYEAERDSSSGTITPRQFPDPAGWNPAPGTCCRQPDGKCAPNVAAWQTVWANATWQALNFSVEEPFRYSYRTTAEAGPAGPISKRRWQGFGTEIGDVYHIEATGDLDCDGTYSLFQRTATIDEQYNVNGGPGLVVVNDVE